MRTYTENRYGDYRETDAGNTIRSNGASCGGGSEVLVIETLVFDEGQITNPKQGSHPTWGGCCHALTGNAGRTVIIIRENSDDLSDGNRDAESRRTSGQL